MSVASAVYERTCHVCDAVKYHVFKTFLNIQRGRQLSANYKIMNETHIWNRGDKDLAYHLQQMNEPVNQEYDRKISNLKREFRWGWEDNGEI